MNTSSTFIETAAEIRAKVKTSTPIKARSRRLTIFAVSISSRIRRVSSGLSNQTPTLGGRAQRWLTY